MAQKITTSRDPDYKDLDLDFMRNPRTDQLIVKTGVDAVKRSVRNLLLTNYYERPFQSYLGSGIRALLFENATPMTALRLEDAIRLTLQNFEPRIELTFAEYNSKRIDGVLVEPDIDNNGFRITVSFIIKNSSEPVITSLFLERIR